MPLRGHGTFEGLFNFNPFDSTGVIGGGFSLSRDTYYGADTTLGTANGDNFRSNNWRIFCSATITIVGILNCNGGDSGGSVHSHTLAGGVGAAAGYFNAGQVGGDGGIGNGTGGAGGGNNPSAGGGAGGIGLNISPSLGGSVGGAGGRGGGFGGAGGNAILQATSGLPGLLTFAFQGRLENTAGLVTAAGAPGGGGGACGDTGDGGGGGGGAGTVFICARRIVLAAGSTIQARGGNGAAGLASGTNNGGGGGGAGGAIILCYSELVNNGGTFDLSGGTPGDPYNIAQTAGQGATGNLYLYQM